MDVKIGDRVSIDSLKVGQPRRAGTVQRVEQGLSGVRYLVRWEDGHETFFSPSGGNLIVERRARPAAGKGKAAAKAQKKPAAKAKKKPAAKAKKKPTRKR